jgi:hypothetical protein
VKETPVFRNRDPNGMGEFTGGFRSCPWLAVGSGGEPTRVLRNNLKTGEIPDKRISLRWCLVKPFEVTVSGVRTL